MMHIYRIGLGDLIPDKLYPSHPSFKLIWFYFILATFFTQIVLLNMLIAILSTTFGRVSEASERTDLLERTKMYTDFLWLISLTTELKGQRYLYLVSPKDKN